MQYTAIRREQPPQPDADWDGPYWADVQPLHISNFHDRSSDHHPPTAAKVVHTGRSVHLIFRVEDRYVRCVHTGLHGMVCRDSCVEAFLQPGGQETYFNFEMNAGGTLLLYHVVDPSRDTMDEPIARRTPITPEQAERITITPDLPETVEPEITEPTTWCLRLSFPLELMEAYLGPMGELSGQQWRANFYKCGDQTSHPHWGAWSPVTGQLNFHRPECFGQLTFA
jgi:hypothetical protein